jgi:hypothetical protein
MRQDSAPKDLLLVLGSCFVLLGIETVLAVDFSVCLRSFSALAP